MTVKEAVEKYLTVTGEFGRPMPLAAFGLDQEATEAMLAAWDEDYQLHRHLELISLAQSAPRQAETGERTSYSVGGIEYAEIVIRASIRAVTG